MGNDKELYQLLKLITKISNNVIRSAEHLDIKGDVVNEVFLKVYDTEFIREHDLKNEEQALAVASYIKKAVKTSYFDCLVKLGILRRSTKVERESTGLKTQNIKTVSIESDGNDDSVDLAQSDDYSHDQYLAAKRAYLVIESCFKKAIETVKEKAKSEFIQSAFWDYGNFDFPLKKLAEVVGYEKSNPTQDFNRFVEKVNLCTNSHDIRIVNVGEQIDILRQIIYIGEARI